MDIEETEELVAYVHQKWNASTLITVKADKQLKVKYFKSCFFFKTQQRNETCKHSAVHLI